MKLPVICASADTTSFGVLDQHSQWLIRQIIRNHARQGLKPKLADHTNTCQGVYEQNIGIRYENYEPADNRRQRDN